ncbi:Hypothetical protein POVR2_LOCUS209 [uncultured virus]|nr:Hypothetical protein POVR2_LOCUS209 [uncultured virus]
MNLPEIQAEVTSWLDNDTLEKLYTSGLLASLLDLATSNIWWHSRVETLSGSRLAYQATVDWKQTYQVVDYVKKPERRPGIWNSEDNVTAVIVLEKMGHGATESDLAMCCKRGSVNILRYLLDQRQMSLNQGLMCCITSYQPEVLEMLLKDDRISLDIHPELLDNVISISNPTHPARHLAIVKILLADNRLPLQASWISHSYSPEVIKLLLADTRIDPSENQNALLIRAIVSRRAELVALLLENKRVRVAIDEIALRAAHGHGGPHIYSLVLDAFGQCNKLA